MSKKLCIFGAGGFAKEVYWLARQCGREVAGFIDVQEGAYFFGVPVYTENFFDPSKHLAVVAIGNPILRQKIVNGIIANFGENVFDTLISPSANIMSHDVQIGKGSVISANCVLTCSIILGPWSQLNLATTIGHDVVTNSFLTTAPGVHLSGKLNIGSCVYFGTNSSTVEEISICDNVTIGAGACVTRDILDPGTYVGIPAKLLKGRG